MEKLPKSDTYHEVSRKFLEKDGSQLFFIHNIFKMSNREIELIETRKQDKTVAETVVETKPREVGPVSISTLFLRYSSKGERVLLFFGFTCT